MELRKFTIGSNYIDLRYTEKTVEFDPSLPYLYVPKEDFDRIAA